MFRWRSAPFCILILTSIVSATVVSSLSHRGAPSFSNSLRLTRTIRSRVQQLLSQYKQEVLGDKLFESREMMLSSLPAVTVSFPTWLHMQDAERLRVASHYLQTFWTHLEKQRQLLERERDATKERREGRDKRGKPQPTLCQSFAGLQIDLRDLMKQVNSQLNSIIQISASTKSPVLHLLHSTSSLHTNGPRGSVHSTVQSTQTFISTTGQTSVSLRQPTQRTTTLATSRWVQHLNGYVILRDLDRYLRRLARDYSVLQTKY